LEGIVANIIRVEHSREKPYLTLSTATIRELRNDLQALGLLVDLLARPDDWRVRTDALAKDLGVGKTTVLKVLSRLIDRGYVKRADIRRRAPDGSGRLYERRTVYTVFEDKGLAAAWTEESERQRAREDDGAVVLQYGPVPF
jgi:DNA-binding MarR family transcriptional regulator